jgi:hypothetical protein
MMIRRRRVRIEIEQHRHGGSFPPGRVVFEQEETGWDGPGARLFSWLFSMLGRPFRRRRAVPVLDPAAVRNKTYKEESQ